MKVNVVNEIEKAVLPGLIAGCLKNRKEHQKKLYKIFYGFAYSIVLRYASNEETASVILNKGFYSAFSCLNDYKETTTFKEWLRYIMVQASIRYYLDHKQIHHLPDKATADDIDFRSYHSEKIFSYRNAINMLHQLPDLYRIVFNLFAVEGYAHEKIAALLHIPPLTSENILANARRKLSSLMAAE